MRGELPNLYEIIFIYRHKKLPVCFSLFFFFTKRTYTLSPLRRYKSGSVSEIAYAKLSTDSFMMHL